MLLLIKSLGGYMRSSKVYKAAREYLGLRREDVCAILGWDLEDLIAIEEGYIPSLDMQGQLYRLYGINDDDFRDIFKYTESLSYKGLSEKDIKSVAGLFKMADELKSLDRD